MANDVSLVRLNALRAGYLLLVIGLGLTVWPGILTPARTSSLMGGAVTCLLGAIGLLALLGLRYPLQMLPLLFFEMTWKAIWLLRIGLPLWLSHRLDADAVETAFECLMAGVFLVVVPWRYVWARYVRARGDPWLRRPSGAA